jgi:hypothetical protein
MIELRADRGPALPSGLRVELIERAGSRAQAFADPAGEARTQGYGHRRDLDAVAAELNDRPWQTLGWKSPCQALDEALQ